MKHFVPVTKIVVLVVSVLTLACVLAPMTTVAAEPVTIRVATASDAGELAITRQIVAMFEAENPHIKVDLIPITNRVDEQVVLIAGGLAPDIHYLNPNYFGYFVRQGFLDDLRPYVEASNFPLDDLYASLVAQMGDDGRLYGLPFGLTSMALLYNQTLFSEAGLPEPSTQWNDDAWNWPTFVDHARRLTQDVNQDGTTDRWGIGLILGALDQITYPWVFSNGGSIFDTKTGSFSLSEPASTEALQFLADLINEERVALGPMWGVDNFTNETVAMLPFGRWLTTLEDLPFDWNVAPLPKGKNAATMIVWAAYGISAASQHKDEAWEFMQFLMTEEVQLLNATEGQGLSPLTHLAAHPDLRYAEPSGHYAVFAEGIQYAQPIPYADNDGQISGAIWNALVPVWSGNESAQQAMDRIKAPIEALLAETTLGLVAPN